MFGLFKSKRQRYFENCVMFYAQFALAADVPAERVKSLMPPLNAVASILFEAFQTGMKPVDGGVILADLGVREALNRKKLADGGTMGELGEAWAEGMLHAAEKIQAKAFELGTQAGAKVVPKEGAFGRMISEKLGAFLSDGPSFKTK